MSTGRAAGGRSRVGRNPPPPAAGYALTVPTTPAEAHALALALPGSSEAPHFNRVAFRVGGKVFATLDPHGSDLNLMLSPELQAEVLAAWPTLTFPVHGGWGRMGATTVRLDEATSEQVAALLERSWSRRAPARLRKARGG